MPSFVCYIISLKVAWTVHWRLFQCERLASERTTVQSCRRPASRHRDVLLSHELSDFPSRWAWSRGTSGCCHSRHVDLPHRAPAPFTGELGEGVIIEGPRGLQICDPAATSTRYDLCVYQHLEGGVAGINCAMIITAKTRWDMTNSGAVAGNTVSV